MINDDIDPNLICLHLHAEYSQRQSQIAMEFAAIAHSQDDPIVGMSKCDSHVTCKI
jgi:hypothetical protein